MPLSRIRKFSGPNLHRNWVMIPHVTNNDEADVTDLEAFRKRLNAEDGAKVTMLAFAIKACVAALAAFPDVNSSLDGDELIHKKYYNIGFAADTPLGLVVPVVRHADRKGIREIAAETAALAAKARDGKLGMGDMSGATFTISSLGGIGGTSFTADRQRTRSRDPRPQPRRRQTRVGRHGLRAPFDVAALALVRSSRDRRRARGALQRVPRCRARRSASRDALGLAYSEPGG